MRVRKIVATVASVTAITLLGGATAFGSDHQDAPPYQPASDDLFGWLTLGDPAPAGTQVAPSDSLSPFGGTSSLAPEATGVIAIGNRLEVVINPGEHSVNLGHESQIVFPRGDDLISAGPSPYIPPFDTTHPVAGMNELVDLLFPSDNRDNILLIPPARPLSGAGPFIIRGGTFLGEIPLDNCEFLFELGFADLNSGQPPWVPNPAFPNDLFTGASQATVTRCQNGEWLPAFRLVNNGTNFAQAPTDTYTILGEKGFLQIQPLSELLGHQGSRLFTFMTPQNGGYQPDNVGFFADPAFPEFGGPVPVIIGDPFFGFTNPPDFLGSGGYPINIDFSAGTCPPDGFSNQFIMTGGAASRQDADFFRPLILQFPDLDRSQIAREEFLDVSFGEFSFGTYMIQGDSYQKTGGLYDFDVEAAKDLMRELGFLEDLQAGTASPEDVLGSIQPELEPGGSIFDILVEVPLTLSGAGGSYTESYVINLGTGLGSYSYVQGDSECTWDVTIPAEQSQGLAEALVFNAVATEVHLAAEASAPESTTTAQASSTTIDLTGANLEGGSFSRTLVFWILIGGGLVLVSIPVYWRTQERKHAAGGTAEQTPPVDVGGTRVRPPTQPKPPLPPTVYGEELDDTHVCDWAVYFNDGGVRVALRSAAGYECCFYDINIGTSVTHHSQATKGRQQPDLATGVAEAPEGRLQIVEHGLNVYGLGMTGWATARSGPHGRLDWMQGLGDSRHTNTEGPSETYGPQHEQRHQLEDPPEAAVHLSHGESTIIAVVLTPGCEEHSNEYSSGGQGELTFEASSECTNQDAHPACPVELSAQGHAYGYAWGDLGYSIEESGAGDPDELDLRTVELLDADGHRYTEMIAAWDGHDHEARSRATFPSTVRGSGASLVRTDDLSINLVNSLSLDTGIIVPPRVWDTTERVTADLSAEIGHKIKIDGAMTAGCEPGCHGHGRCDCAPRFTLELDGSTGEIEVDGERHAIHWPTGGGTWRLG